MKTRLLTPFAWLLAAGLTACTGVPNPVAGEPGENDAIAQRRAATATAPATAASGNGANAPAAGDATPGETAADRSAASGQGEERADEQANDEANEQADERQHAAAADEGSLPANELTPQIMFQVLAAEVAAQRQQHSAAVATYLSLARRTRDPRLARRGTELALASRMLPQAVESAELWRELAPESERAAITVETLWLASGQFDKAEPLLARRLVQARADGKLRAAYAMIERAFAQARDAAGALALLDRISAEDLDVPAARMARAAAAQRAGNTDRAVGEAEHALELAPEDEAVVRALAAYARGASEAARTRVLERLDRFVATHQDALQVRFAYAQLLGVAGKSAAAREQFERILQARPDDPATLLSLSQLAYESGQPEQAERYLERYIALPDTEAERKEAALMFLGRIAEEADRHEQALDWYRRIDPGEHYVSAVARRALIHGKQGRVDEGRALLTSVEPRSEGERVRLLAAESQLLREARRDEEAFEVLEAGLARSPDNADLLYDHGLAAERVNRLDAMERSMRRLMELRPDQAHAFNALGYSLADRNVRLPEALELIEKAHAISPDDPYILDSLGWVHFRLGNLEQAAGHLRRAYAMRPEAEIATHLGEVLWVMGRTDEAIELWRAARSKEPDNETLRATLARLNIAL